MRPLRVAWIGVLTIRYSPPHPLRLPWAQLANPYSLAEPLTHSLTLSFGPWDSGTNEQFFRIPCVSYSFMICNAVVIYGLWYSVVPRSCISTHLLIINAHWIAAFCRSDNSSTVLNRPVCGHMAGQSKGANRARFLSMSSGWEFPQSVDSIVETNTVWLCLISWGGLQSNTLLLPSVVVALVLSGYILSWIHNFGRDIWRTDGRDIIRGHQSSIYKINPISFRILCCYPLIGCSIFWEI